MCLIWPYAKRYLIAISGQIAGNKRSLWVNYGSFCIKRVKSNESIPLKKKFEYIHWVTDISVFIEC